MAFIKRWPSYRVTTIVRFHCSAQSGLATTDHHLEWRKLVFNVFPENCEMEEVKGHSCGGGGPLLALLPKPHLLSQEAEVRFMGQETQHDLGEGGGKGRGENCKVKDVPTLVGGDLSQLLLQI